MNSNKLNIELKSALENHRAGRLKEAEVGYLKVLRKSPGNEIAQEFLIEIYLETRNTTQAIKYINKLIHDKKTSEEKQLKYAHALLSLKENNAAQDILETITKNKKSELGNYLLGLSLTAQKKHREAIEAFSRIPEADKNYVKALEFQIDSFFALQQYQDAIEKLSLLIALKPESANLYQKRGLSFAKIYNWELAAQDIMSAIKIEPRNAISYISLGEILSELTLFSSAGNAYCRALALDPNRTALMSTIVGNRHKGCDWTHFEEDNQYLIDLIANKKSVENPFFFLNITDSGSDQIKCANFWGEQYREKTRKDHAFEPITRSKIRIGYVSSDYHNHATAILIEKLFKTHDRSGFEIIGISLLKNRNDEITERIRRNFDSYHEVADLSNHEIAEKIKGLEIDILIDLKGYTKNSRTEIFAYRPSPVQVSYLGFPGTMGVDFMDYIISDDVVTPKGHEDFYSEKIVRLPTSYQINNNERQIAEKSGTREAHGLPPAGFVFCCFNNSYKITPQVFSIWMRLLQQVAHSVLWLLHDNDDAVRNLRKEATQRGVDPTRLVFAPRQLPELHLARHCHADLFLDTLPINAHTTASDALWAGLPLLTCPGEAFAARVAASLLTSAGLPELIASDWAEYERLALQLATEPGRLAELKARLQANRLTCDLFNTEKTTRALETAYRAMHARRQAGLPPTHLDIRLDV
ncbi:tetratricopeptide repeat protein [Malikia sp.]|uniref:tetratricopeptide repeat protein n=1 Tax=Malikia sp. TaxID=2070706 RepID=UPI00260699C6|nr:tetratricopeptide repeat protein [Malikia sp.]MDD2727893.1 tetratricopeptide repeat protein [Malikia sp.]